MPNLIALALFLLACFFSVINVVAAPLSETDAVPFVQSATPQPDNILISPEQAVSRR